MRFAFVALGLLVAVTRAGDFNAATSFIKPSIDQYNFEGTQPVGRPAPLQRGAAVLLPGSRCFANFATKDGRTGQSYTDDVVKGYDHTTGNSYPFNKADLDGIVCAGQADPAVKEMNGDSGGPALATIDGEFECLSV